MRGTKVRLCRRTAQSGGRKGVFSGVCLSREARATFCLSDPLNAKNSPDVSLSRVAGQLLPRMCDADRKSRFLFDDGPARP
jgi:hypothetical protein